MTRSKGKRAAPGIVSNELLLGCELVSFRSATTEVLYQWKSVKRALRLQVGKRKNYFKKRGLTLQNDYKLQFEVTEDCSKSKRIQQAWLTREAVIALAFADARASPIVTSTLALVSNLVRITPYSLLMLC